MKQEMKGWQWHQLDYIRIICTCRETVDFVEIYQYCANWCGAFWDDCQRLLLQLALSSANGVSDQTRREFVQPPDSHQLASVGGGQYWMPKVTVFVIFIHWWGLLKYVWIVGADCLWIERCCSSLVSGISEITKCCATDIMGLCGTMSMFCAFVHQIYFYLVCYFVKGCKILWWVYLFISLFTHLRSHTAILHQYVLWMLPVAVARSSSDSVAICSTVLWMTSCFHLVGPVVHHVYAYNSTLFPFRPKIAIEHW